MTDFSKRFDSEKERDELLARAFQTILRSPWQDIRLQVSATMKKLSLSASSNLPKEMHSAGYPPHGD
jgi:hypothetical protein